MHNEEEAERIIKETKKKYYDARHNCYAYRIMDENTKSIVERQSDDGEPSGTAGGPILNVLKQNDLCNVLAIVTRYFGGILLGTGGLVRAYTTAVIDAIQNSSLANEMLGIEVEAEVEYTNLEKLKYFAKVNEIQIVDVIYENKIKCYIQMPEECLEKLGKEEIVNSYKIVKNVYIRKSINIS